MDIWIQERKAAILKGLAHPVRLSIVEELEKGEKCACEIASMFDADRTTVSKHLAVLRSLGIVCDRREGLNIIYRLAIPCLVQTLRCVEDVVQRGCGESCGKSSSTSVRGT